MQETEPSKEMHRVGYARVSTADQDPQMQIDALLRDGVREEDIYSETVSGAAKKRPQLNEMLREVRAGHVVTIWKLDRLGRTLRQVLETIDRIHAAGAHLRIITQQLDTSTPMGKCMLAMIAAFAELERDLAIERTKAGLEAAAARGRRGGARPQYTEEDIERAAKAFREGVTYKELAETVRSRRGRAITPTQLKRRIDEWNAKNAQDDVMIQPWCCLSCYARFPFGRIKTTKFSAAHPAGLVCPSCGGGNLHPADGEHSIEYHGETGVHH